MKDMGLCCWRSSSSDLPPNSTTSNSSQIPALRFTSYSTTTNVSSTTATTGSQLSEAGSEWLDGRSINGTISETPNLNVFSFMDLKIASRNFSPDTFLGQGGFGKVYKGWVDEKTLAPSRTASGMLIAIKKLNPGSTQGFNEWQSEVNFLGRLSHRNLVKLLGYCWEDKELLLVYEFMPRGSLENHLFRRNRNVEPLSWDLRLKIATGAAKGLTFLHSPDVQVIYRDFKAANILLDSDYNAKMSDFGLARLGPGDGRSHVTTRIMGTSGYAAPEYMATGHLYVKSDVYGFGVVLLEIMTGLRAFDTSRPKEQHRLVEWLRPSLYSRRKVKGIMDKRIEGQYSSKAATLVAEITMRCLELDPKRRPSMKEVVEVLEQVQAIERQRRIASEPSSYSATHHNDWQVPSRPRTPFCPGHCDVPSRPRSPFRPGHCDVPSRPRSPYRPGRVSDF